MNRRSQWLRGFKIILVAVVLLLLVFNWVRYSYLRVQTAWADDQIWYFQEMVSKATHEDGTNNAAKYAEAIKNYYPSGTKQGEGTHLDKIVERSRALAIELIEQRVAIGTNATAR